MTTITTGSTVPEQTRLSTDDGNVLSGALVGVHVASAREAVVLFQNDHAASGTITSARYVVAQNADADHMIFDVAASSNGYAVTAVTSNGKLTIDVAPGGPFTPTAQGTLYFTMTKDGTAQPPPPPPSNGDAGAPPPSASDAGTSGDGGSPPLNPQGC
jgi:hypothetical protein